MAQIDLAGQIFTTGDGKVSFDLGALPASTVVNAVMRTCEHVFGNEAISKASTAKAKANGVLDDAERDDIIAKAREAYKAAMLGGTWGDKGSRAPRMVAANRLEQIFNTLAADDTRKALAKEGFKADESKKGHWFHTDGNSYPLSEWMTAYLGHAELGADRKASLDRRAKAKYDAELAEAEQRKADKERESKVAKGASIGLSI